MATIVVSRDAYFAVTARSSGYRGRSNEEEALVRKMAESKIYLYFLKNEEIMPS